MTGYRSSGSCREAHMVKLSTDLFWGSPTVFKSRTLFLKSFEILESEIKKWTDIAGHQ